MNIDNRTHTACGGLIKRYVERKSPTRHEEDHEDGRRCLLSAQTWQSSQTVLLCRCISYGTIHPLKYVPGIYQVPVINMICSYHDLSRTRYNTYRTRCAFRVLIPRLSCRLTGSTNHNLRFSAQGQAAVLRFAAVSTCWPSNTW